MNKRALIIDDTKNIRLLLAKCLELEGWDTLSVQNGKEGLDRILDERFDLIILDIKLPEMSGTEVLRRIRGAGLMTPIIVITAYPTIKNAVDCTRLGVVSYLQKPFTAERLRTVLQDLNISGGAEGRNEQKKAIERAISEGDTVRARNLLGVALAEDPSDASLYMMLSRIYSDMGDEEIAIKFSKVHKILIN